MIRPSVRGLGYGSLILSLALKECKGIITDLEKNEHKVLLACRVNNLLSKRVILKHGGVFEKVVLLKDGISKQALFWIKV